MIRIAKPHYVSPSRQASSADVVNRIDRSAYRQPQQQLPGGSRTRCGAVP